MSTALKADILRPEPDYEDGVHYPSSDGKPLAESDYQLLALIPLRHALEDFFHDRPDVYISTDLFWYWQQGNPNKRRAPDIMVIPGVGRRPRRSFRTWREGGAVPAAIFEITSGKTWRLDLGEKRDLYQALGVSDYFVFDPEDRYVKPVFQGFRLRRGRYVRIRAAADGGLASDLGFRARAEGGQLRLIDARTGEPIPSREERAARERQRADALAAENEQLRAQLNQPGGPPAP
jgi:Uma2 family endonuclease